MSAGKMGFQDLSNKSQVEVQHLYNDEPPSFLDESPEFSNLVLLIDASSFYPEVLVLGFLQGLRETLHLANLHCGSTTSDVARPVGVLKLGP